ncbi:HEPN domain protein [bacterium BMS3Abin04]|nr:HEPN domain protein [bacterium BMS3Abin04]
MAIEKQLKPLFIKENKDFPPKTHKLLHLALKSNIKLNVEIKIFFSKLMEFQLEGRYPEIITTPPNYDKAVSILEKTKEALLWLQQM